MYRYIPPVDAEINTGHFIIFFNEFTSIEAADSILHEPTSISIEIIQEGKSIINDEIDAGNWTLSPIPEGVYLVNLEINFSDQPITVKRTCTSKVGTVNCLNIDFWQLEPTKLKADVQVKRALFTGKTAGYILNSRREEKPLKFETLLKMESKP
ncbi:MAG: hypothetical protein L6422_07450 [Candidatus Marinimicrobia bacterium]|nr:hypothetical protein [bacterium]MCG2716105.1 hypothetical protein [Candidatus Neomarinimicrobiota bacterium]